MAKSEKTKPMQVCSFGPVQDLYEAAKNVIDTSAATGYWMPPLKAAVAALEAAAKTSALQDRVREIASKEYIDSNCDIDIDDTNLTHHNGEHSADGGGWWVGAWLWVSDLEASTVSVVCPKCNYDGLATTFHVNSGGHCCPECGYQGEKEDGGHSWEEQFPDDLPAQCCHECGGPFRTSDVGVTEHLLADGSVDHDRDALHTAFALPETLLCADCCTEACIDPSTLCKKCIDNYRKRAAIGDLATVKRLIRHQAIAPPHIRRYLKKVLSTSRCAEELRETELLLGQYTVVHALYGRGQP